MAVFSDQDYAFASGRVRALESRLFDMQRLVRLIETPGVDEALKILSDGGYLTDAGPEGSLSLELQRLYEFVEKTTPDKNIVELFTLKYLFHDIKAQLRRGMPDALEAPASGLSSRAPHILAAIESERYDSLPEGIREAVKEALQYREEGDPHSLDAILDKHMLSLQVKVARGTGNSTIVGYFQGLIDMTNLALCLRAKARDAREDLEYLVDGGTVSRDTYIKAEKMPWDEVASAFGTSPVAGVVTKAVQGYLQDESFGVMEKAIDEYLLVLGRRGRYSAMGAELIAGYIVMKESEIKNIRFILAGKEVQRDAADLRERLRDIHG